jgi:hypothetical protein
MKINLEFTRVFFFLATVGVVFWFLFFAWGCEPSQGPELLNDCSETLAQSDIISVHVVTYENESALLKAFKEINPETELTRENRMQGFATYRPRIQLHTLHVLKIRGQNDHDRIETLGHELIHSFCGEWHPRVAGSF